VVFIEYSYDPDPDDTRFEETFVYLIRTGSQVQVESDPHVNGVFSLETWPRLIRDVGFEVERSTWVEGIPMFIGIKRS
jgi:hypothetical protein